MDKNKLNYISIILAICVVLAGLGGYYLGLHYADNGNVEETKNEENKPTEETQENEPVKEETNESTEGEKSEELENDLDYETGKKVDDKLGKKLFEKTLYVGITIEDYYMYLVDRYSNTARPNLIKKITYDSLVDETKLSMALYFADNKKFFEDPRYSNLEDNPNYSYYKGIELDIKDLKESYINLFGSDKKFPSLNKGFDYDAETKYCEVNGQKIICKDGGYGDVSNTFVYIEYDKAVKQNDDEIYIYSNLWYGFDGNDYLEILEPDKYYEYANKKVEMKIINELPTNYDWEKTISILSTKYKDLAKRCKVTFKKDTNGNYYWEKTEKVK